VVGAVNRHGGYVGGAIAPGLGIAAEALFQRAARLYRVELTRPRAVIGRNTVAAMQSGIVYGYVALVEGMVARFREELGADAKVVATGGGGHLIGAAAKGTDPGEPPPTPVRTRPL